jgi:DNA replication protein DnaC
VGPRTPYSGRKLDRALIRQLATCRWVAEHQNVLITGPTGVGKSFLACALGQQACRLRHRVIYRRIPRLFPELTLAHGTARTRRCWAALHASTY